MRLIQFAAIPGYARIGILMISSRRGIQFTSTKARVDRLFIFFEIQQLPTAEFSLNSFDISDDDGTKTIGKDQKGGGEEGEITKKKS